MAGEDGEAKQAMRAAGAGAASNAPEGFDDVALDPRIDRLIGRSLEHHYADILAAPLPDQFLVLLAQLEAAEKAGEREKGEARS